MLRNRAAIAFVLVLLVVAMALGGCAAATPQTVVQEVTVPVEVTKVVEVTVEVTTVVEKEVVVTPTPAAPADATRLETLNIALSGQVADPTNLNIYAPGVSRSGTGIHQVIYEYFFYQNLQTGEYIPWLAESYEYSEDFTQLSVKLREGVTWSDGEAFTAEDVVFTYDTLLANPGMTWASEVTKWVESVEAVDDYNVTFNLLAPSPRFHLNREAFPAVGIWGGITILPKHVWENEDPLTFKSTDPIGTGAYRLVNATTTSFTFERRDDWWGTTVWDVVPAPRTINFQYVGPETTVALALAANEIDTPFIGILSVGSLQEIMRRNPNVHAWTDEPPYAWLDPCPRPLMVNNAVAPWDQKEARWALSYMIDREAIVALAYEGTTVPAWGIWPNYDGNQPYFDAIADLLEQYPSGTYDPAKGEELLQSIGYTKGDDGMWVSAEGEPLRVRYLVQADSTEEMKVSAVLADQLQTQGIEVELQPLAGGVMSDTILRGEYDIKLHSFCPGYIYENLELFNSKFYVPLGEAAPWYERNSFRYNNPEFSAIVDEMGSTSPDDTETIIAQFHDAMAIWLDELPVVPIVQAPALVPFNTTYWEGWPSATDPWNMPVSWWATFELVLTGYTAPETGEWVGGIHPAGQ
mgnify:FL=1